MRVSGVVALALSVLLALALLTLRQIGYWRSSYDLWAHALDVTQDNFIADNHMGELLLKQGRPEALDYYLAAARIAPWDPVSHGAVASSLQDRGDFQGAISEYEIVLRASPDPELEANACVNLGVIYRELGDYPKARDYSERALRVDSETVQQRIAQLSDFIAAHPAAPGYFQLGLLLEGAGQLSQARISYQRALRLDANFEPARRALGVLAGSP